MKLIFSHLKLDHFQARAINIINLPYIKERNLILAADHSMPEALWFDNQNLGGSFTGFVRGLAYDNRYYYVGLTNTMYASRLTGIRNNTMCNTGFFLFDPNLKTSRFYTTPDLMNIHSLLVEVA